MTKPLFPKWFLPVVVGFFIGLFAFVPLHFWMLARHTGDIEQGITENQAMIERLRVEQLTTLKLILSEYREEIEKIKEFNSFVNQSK